MHLPLILVPTPLEAEIVQGFLRASDVAVHVETIGFGPVASGIAAGRLFVESRVSSACLIGIAGSYHLEQLPVGTAAEFTHVGMWGVGATSPNGVQLPSDMKLEQAPGVFETLQIQTGEECWLLSVTAASGMVEDIEQRLARFPQAVAEDMESFSVALAARTYDVDLHVFRGISNLVGIRDQSQWKVEEALRAACELMVSEWTRVSQHGQ